MKDELPTTVKLKEIFLDPFSFATGCGVLWFGGIPPIGDVVPSVLACDQDLFQLNRCMTIEQQYLTIDFIDRLC